MEGTCLTCHDSEEMFEEGELQRIIVLHPSALIRNPGDRETKVDFTFHHGLHQLSDRL